MATQTQPGVGLASEDLDKSRGSVGEVFAAFLKLGLTSFGGPIAHLGYFRDELVLRRRWLDEAAYADLVALCQFLPGPASSQVGFALGLRRAGLLGALAALTGFTLPSAAAMFAFAYAAQALTGPIGLSLIHGLKLVAVAIVAQAVVGMARTLTPDLPRAAIALAAGIVALLAGPAGQIAAVLFGATAGMLVSRYPEAPPMDARSYPLDRRVAFGCGAIFLILLVASPLLARVTGSQGLAVFDAFYRSGALVFGGGHVVLPLLQAEIVDAGWTDEGTFLAGYGAAQAVPGPLFSFAAYLGAVLEPSPNGLVGAAIALVGIFLPGFLILLAALPFWANLRRTPAAQAALRGTSAAVVGILAAALYDPVWTGGVSSPIDMVIALAGFLALMLLRAPPWVMVVGVTIATVAAAALV